MCAILPAVGKQDAAKVAYGGPEKPVGGKAS